jgi:hypothetical protein
VQLTIAYLLQIAYCETLKVKKLINQSLAAAKWKNLPPIQKMNYKQKTSLCLFEGKIQDLEKQLL